MYVRVRTVGTSETVTITVSRAAIIQTFKELVEQKLKIKPENQRLFYSGKQLENQYRLYDYGININDVIQVVGTVDNEKTSTKKKPSKDTKNVKNETLIPSCSSAATSSTSHNDDSDDIFYEGSKYFRVNDYVDIKDHYHGAWFVGKLVKIKKDKSLINEPSNSKNDGLIYCIEFEGCEKEPLTEVKFPNIRPCASYILPFTDLKEGETIFMNYNIDYPKERGFWYDVFVKKKIKTKNRRAVLGDISGTKDNALLVNCLLIFVDDMFKINNNTLLKERSAEYDKIMQSKPVPRAGPLICIDCKDNENKLCKECGCQICGGKDNNDLQVMCDECNKGFHLACLTPPLTDIPPEDDWYCPSCKNDENEIVKAGGELKTTKKKTPGSKSSRDWGKGMACVGRTKICNIVPSNHFGSIPGVEVGTTWLYRVQVSEAGIHRPPVGGIHGRDMQGAFSIVLSGGYEDDVDNGEEFLYTGSGGRDLSGNKRTALQSCNQELTRFNKALAINCNVKIDKENGATAVNWKKGKPVRVVRNYKLQKHSKYAPSLGNRYDGLYKVVKYYPETGKSGYIVWRFVLRRDDPTPAPWTNEGKKRMAQLGLEIIYPENYTTDKPEKNPKLSDSKKKRKSQQDTDIENNDQCKSIESNSSGKANNKKKCLDKKVKTFYELEKDAKRLIKADTTNKKYWDDCQEFMGKGKKVFLDRVEETFSCICCQEIVFEPITTKCFHNICKGCLIRSFNAEVFQCPACRAELGMNYPMNINMELANTLLYLFPGYNVDR